MTATFVIERATPSDVGDIVQLISELAEFERLLDQCVASPEQLREHLFGARPYAEVLMARQGGQSIGFALFFHNFSTFLTQPGVYLEDIYVRPAHRGQGVGEALLRAVARIAVERGCGRFEWSVLDWNQRAIDFYKKLGAIQLTDWTVHRVAGPALIELAK